MNANAPLNNCYFIPLLLLLSFSGMAQGTLDHVWSRPFNNPEPQAGDVRGRGVTTDAAGNIIVAGTFANTADFDPGPGTRLLFSTGGDNVFFAKYNPAGSLLFAQSIGASDCSDILVDAAGNIYITGSFQNTVDFDPGPGVTNLVSGALNTQNIYVAKYGPNGNLLMAVRVSPASGASNALALDNEGNIFVTGRLSSRAFFSKISPTGEVFFTHTLTNANSDRGNDIAIDAAGNIYLTGEFVFGDFDPGPEKFLLPNNGGKDAFLAKYDNNGNFIFAKNMGGSSNDHGYCMAIDGNGHIWVGGNFTGTADFDPSAGTYNMVSAGSEDIFLAKYDAAGNFLLANRIGAIGSDVARGMVLGAANSVYITGEYFGEVDFDPGSGSSSVQTTGSNLFVAGYQSNADFIFARSMSCSPGSPRGWDIATHNNQLFVTGNFTGTTGSSGANDIAFTAASTITNSFILGLTASAGATVAAWQIGGGFSSTTVFSDVARAIARDNAGNIYMAGSFRGTVDFDPSEAVANLTSAGEADIVMAKYSPDGNFIFAKRIGGNLSEQGTDIFIDAGGNVLLTGQFVGTVDFDPDAGVANLASSGTTNPDVFFAKYNSNGEYVWAQRLGSTGFDEGGIIVADASGNIYLSGRFSATVDFDPGAGVANLTSAGQTDLFLARYNPSGAFSWAFRVGSTSFEFPRAIAFDHLGNIILAGSFIGSVAFNPDASANTPALVAAGSNYDIFLAKYTPSGQYVFANRMGNTPAEHPYGMAVNSLGEIFITGTFSGTVDFDPGAGEANLTGLGTSALFIAKYDNDGNYQFARMVTGNNASAVGNALRLGKNGDIFIAGNFSGTVDADPGPGEALLTATSSLNVFLAGYSNTGAYLFSGKIGGNGTASGNNLQLDADDNIYTVGFFSRFADFDPGPGEAIRVATNSNDIFLAKYSWDATAQIGPYKTIAPGNWDNPATWQGGKVPPLGAEVMVLHEIIVNVSVICNTLKLEPSGGIQVAPGKELKVLK